MALRSPRKSDVEIAMDMTRRHGSQTSHIVGCPNEKSLWRRKFQPLICGIPVEKYASKGEHSIRLCRTLKGRLIIQLAEHRVAHSLVQWTEAGEPWTAALEGFVNCLKDEVFPACGIDLMQIGRLGAQLILFVIGMAKDFDQIWGHGYKITTPVHETLSLNVDTYKVWLHSPHEAYVGFKTRLSQPQDVRAVPLPLRIAPAARTAIRDPPSNRLGFQSLEDGGKEMRRDDETMNREDGDTEKGEEEEKDGVSDPEFHAEPSAEETQAVLSFGKAMYRAIQANKGTLPGDFTRALPPWLNCEVQASVLVRGQSEDDRIQQLRAVTSLVNTATNQVKINEGTEREAHFKAAAERLQLHWCVAYFAKHAFDHSVFTKASISG